MTDKRPSFQPAPRPRPINDPVATQALQDATHDLGFGRKTSAAEPVEVKTIELAAPPVEAAPRPAAPAPAPAPAPKAKAAKPDVVAPAAPVPSALLAPLKFDIERDLSNFLKMEAVRRGATVKFLILEALAAKGYPVDMANTPEDGRRPRREP